MAALEARAAATGYKQLQARVRSFAAGVNRFVRQPNPFDHFSAMTVALAGGDTRTAIRAAARYCLSRRVEHDFADAKQACAIAEALLERQPEDDFASLRMELEVLHVELNLADDLPATREALGEIRARASARELDQPFLDASVRLALVEQSSGNPREAVAMMTEAVDTYAKADGPRHPSTLSLEGDLTGLLIEAGEYDQAKERLLKLIAWEEVDNWQTRINLATVALPPRGARRCGRAGKPRPRAADRHRPVPAAVPHLGTARHDPLQGGEEAAGPRCRGGDPRVRQSAHRPP